MKTIQPIIDEKETRYYPIVNEAGIATCSCGRELIKQDEDTWKCSGGFPLYRLSREEVIYDKFGNLMARVKPHGRGGENAGE